MRVTETMMHGLRRERFRSMQRTMRPGLGRYDRIWILIVTGFERVRYGRCKI
jgi:hypothetical protein